MGQVLQIVFLTFIVIYIGARILLGQVEIEDKLDKILAELNNQTKTK